LVQEYVGSTEGKHGQNESQIYDGLDIDENALTHRPRCGITTQWLSYGTILACVDVMSNEMCTAYIKFTHGKHVIVLVQKISHSLSLFILQLTWQRS